MAICLIWAMVPPFALVLLLFAFLAAFPFWIARMCASLNQTSGIGAGEPVERDGAVGPFSGELAMQDRAAGRELHREPGIVLVEDDRARAAPQRCFAGDDIAELVHLLALDQSL